jgi:hypothetical protein
VVAQRLADHGCAAQQAMPWHCSPTAMQPENSSLDKLLSQIWYRKRGQVRAGHWWSGARRAAKRRGLGPFPTRRSVCDAERQKGRSAEFSRRVATSAAGAETGLLFRPPDLDTPRLHAPNFPPLLPHSTLLHLASKQIPVLALFPSPRAKEINGTLSPLVCSPTCLPLEPFSPSLFSPRLELFWPPPPPPTGPSRHSCCDGRCPAIKMSLKNGRFLTRLARPL